MVQKQPYSTPKLVALGSVSDLTKTGLTPPSHIDTKGGSVGSPGV